MVYIYGLYSDYINNIRYVGKTNNLEKRLKEHIGDAKRNNNTHKHKWIRQSLNDNFKINICLIEECNENWEEREKYWIKFYKNLTNLTEGGDGGHGNLYNISYNEVKNIIKKENIKSKNEWYVYIKGNKIETLPQNPYEHYKITGEWVSWGDFLGTNKIQDNKLALNYISYEDAKLWIKNNISVKTSIEWKKISKQNKIPTFIPNRPDRYYKKDRGWKGWKDFLSKI